MELIVPNQKDVGYLLPEMVEGLPIHPQQWRIRATPYPIPEDPAGAFSRLPQVPAPTEVPFTPRVTPVPGPGFPIFMIGSAAMAEDYFDDWTSDLLGFPRWEDGDGVAATPLGDVFWDLLPEAVGGTNFKIWHEKNNAICANMKERKASEDAKKEVERIKAERQAWANQSHPPESWFFQRWWAEARWRLGL